MSLIAGSIRNLAQCTQHFNKAYNTTILPYSALHRIEKKHEPAQNSRKLSQQKTT